MHNVNFLFEVQAVKPVKKCAFINETEIHGFCDKKSHKKMKTTNAR